MEGLMKDRAIADYSRSEFDVLRKRLEVARDALRRESCLLQSVARAYYVVYVLASFVGGKHGVMATHTRGGERVTDQDYSHTEFPALVYALYTGLKKQTITNPGSSPGIGSGNYTEREAYRQAGILVQMRMEADYGPSIAAEPYGAAEADAWLAVAKNLAEDLERVL
jgi:hypothetical protein